MPVTAQDYFRIVFDIYPVAWDESPFLYRCLNKSREEVALDVNYHQLYTHTFTSSEPVPKLTLPNPFLRVYRVAYVLNDGKRLFLERKGLNYLYDCKLNLRYPLYYVVASNREVAFVPTQYNAQKDDKVEVYYCPTLPEMRYLADVDTVLSDEFRYLVAWRVVMKLAINDTQYQLYDFFRTQYLLELGRFLRGRV